MILVLLSILINAVTNPMQMQQDVMRIQATPIGYTTPLAMLKESHNVTQGFVCFTPMDVKCIDDICGDPPLSFWRLKVNGDSWSYNANSKIKPTDSVEWEFVSSVQI